MRNLLLTIEYDGTNYHGWQKQKNGITIQEVLEWGIEKITRENVNLIGAGRTDAGVHALGQKANFKTASTIPVSKLPLALNSVLPADIRVVGCGEVSAEFHARYHALRKRYRYRIYNNPFPSAVYRNYFCFVPGRLDLEAMREGASYLTGEKDFTSFCSSGSTARTGIRNIFLLDVIKKGRIIDIVIEANGFLYNMARAISGTLLEAGKGKMAPRYIQEILEKRDRRFAGPTLPPQGLFLEEVYYNLNP